MWPGHDYCTVTKGLLINLRRYVRGTELGDADPCVLAKQTLSNTISKEHSNPLSS